MTNFRMQVGFTLIEVLIAVTLLTVGIISVGVMQSTALTGNHRAVRLTEASALAGHRIEQLTALAYNDPLLQDTDGNGMTGLSDVDNNADHKKEVGGFTVFWNVADNQPVADCKTIRVLVRRVDWGSKRIVSVDTIKVRQ